MLLAEGAPHFMQRLPCLPTAPYVSLLHSESTTTHVPDSRAKHEEPINETSLRFVASVLGFIAFCAEAAIRGARHFTAQDIQRGPGDCSRVIMRVCYQDVKRHLCYLAHRTCSDLEWVGRSRTRGYANRGVQHLAMNCGPAARRCSE
jgi:hypothetical protein